MKSKKEGDLIFMKENLMLFSDIEDTKNKIRKFKFKDFDEEREIELTYIDKEKD